VDGAREGGQRVGGGLLEGGAAAADVDDVLDEADELVAGRQAEVAHAAIAVHPVDHRRRDLVDPRPGGGFGLGDEVVRLERQPRADPRQLLQELEGVLARGAL